MKKLLFVFLVVIGLAWNLVAQAPSISVYSISTVEGATITGKVYDSNNVLITTKTGTSLSIAAGQKIDITVTKDGYTTFSTTRYAKDTFYTEAIDATIYKLFNTKIVITPAESVTVKVYNIAYPNYPSTYTYPSVTSISFTEGTTYKIEFTKSGYATEIIDNYIPDGQDINVSLKIPTNINSDVAGVKVFIYPDYKDVATPVIYNFAKDVTYSITFSYPPYFNGTKTISFVGGSNTTLDFYIKDLNPSYNNREILWKKGINIKSPFIDNYVKDLTNDLVNKYNEVSSDYKKLILETGERNYYFSDDNVGNDLDNYEFITLKDITVSGRHIWEIDHINGAEHKDGNFYAKYSLRAKVNGGNTDLNIGGEEKTKGLYVGQTGPNAGDHKTHDNGSEDIKEVFTINSTNIDDTKDLYYPKLLESFKPPFDIRHGNDTTLTGGENPVWYRIHWENVKVSDIKWYKARSPKPIITTANMHPIYKTIKNKFENTKIVFDYPVKIIGYRLYRLESGEYKYKGGRIEYSLDDKGIRLLEFNSALDIESYIGAGKPIDGDYKIVLGSIDKFNKFYMFDHENFTLDVTPPAITDSQVTAVNNFNKDNPVIMKWQKIDDTVSPLTDQNEYLRFSCTFYDGTTPYSYSNATINQINSIFEIVTGAESNITYNYLKLKNEGRLEIQRIYMIDGSGNEKSIIEETTTEKYIYIYDKTLPVVSYNIAYNTKIFKITDDLTINFSDNFSNINLNNITIIYDTNKSYKLSNFSLSNNDFIKIPLENMSGYEGNFTLSMDVSDDKNNKITPSPSYTFKIDDKAPVLTLSFLDNLSNPITNIIDPINLPSTTFKINVIDTNFTKSKVTITSDYITSSNIFPIANGSNEITVKDWTKSLSTNTNRVYENISITVESYDINNNTTTQTRNIRLYNDSEAPEIIKSSPTTSTENGQAYTLTIKDKTAIKEVAIKLIPQLNTTRDNFGDINENNNWIIIAKDINNNEQIEESISRNVYVFPTYSLCVVAKDCWGKENYIIIGNTNANTYSVIDSKEALLQQFPKVNNVININSNIIYKPKDSTKLTLTIEPDEILNIQTDVSEPRVIYFDGAGYQDKIKIENKGKIIFDNTNNQIKLLGLSGTNSNSYNYSWFGIKNTNTTSTNAVIEIKNQLNTANKITFNNAIAPLTFINPVNSILLKHITFENSFMGIHYIVDNYNSSNNLLLQVFSCSFTNLIYGIKFDVNNIYIGNNKNFDYSKYLKYDNTCSFTNILESNIGNP